MGAADGDSGAIQSSWHWLAVLGAIVFIFSQIGIWHAQKLRFSGDEPAVLMTSISIIKEHSFNVYPSYVARDYAALGFADLGWQVPPVNGYIPPEKGIGFPLLIAPLYAAIGVTGTRLVLLAISALVFPLLFLNCIWAGLSRLSAALGCLGLATLLPWEIHVGLILPEALAGTVTMVILTAYLRFKETAHWSYAFAVGLLTVLLPIVYLKYAAIAVASAALLVADRKLRWNPVTYAAAPLAAAYVILWIAVYGYNISVGTGAGPQDFHLSGFGWQFWSAFIDRDHGEWVWAPITVLATAGLAQWDRRTADVQAYLLAIVVMYAGLYGLTLLKPGDSAPGRYLVAAVPAMVMLAALGMLRKGPFYRPKAVIFCCFSVLSAIILIASVAHQRPYMPRALADQFPRVYYAD